MSFVGIFVLYSEVLINTSNKHGNLNSYCNVCSLVSRDSTCRKAVTFFFEVKLYILRQIFGTMSCACRLTNNY